MLIHILSCSHHENLMFHRCCDNTVVACWKYPSLWLILALRLWLCTIHLSIFQLACVEMLPYMHKLRQNIPFFYLNADQGDFPSSQNIIFIHFSKITIFYQLKHTGHYKPKQRKFRPWYDFSKECFKFIVIIATVISFLLKFIAYIIRKNDNHSSCFRPKLSFDRFRPWKFTWFH